MTPLRSRAVALLARLHECPLVLPDGLTLEAWQADQVEAALRNERSATLAVVLLALIGEPADCERPVSVVDLVREVSKRVIEMG